MSLPSLSPHEALLRLRAAGLPHLALFESAGPPCGHGRRSFLSAAPQHTTPQIPDFPAFAETHFPAWLGGLHYEAAAQFGLSTHEPEENGGWWGFYPSGLVWNHETEEMTLQGEPHFDWAAALALPVPELQPLQSGPLGPDDLDYKGGVRDIQEEIRAGEVYQVNLSRGVFAEATGDPLEAYLRLRKENPSPFMAYLETEESVVVSVSPERLADFCRQTGRVSARPIAGTRRRGVGEAEDEALQAELTSSEKETAEHIMLVDLLRHDIGHICEHGSVHVPEFMTVERYSHVMHLVSEVAGQGRAGLSPRDIFAATFPGGTITGAPKARVMESIARLEPRPRRWYTGSLGCISPCGMDSSILIRTADFAKTPAGWRMTVRAGGGTVIDSNPNDEGNETVHKAQALLGVLVGLAGRPKSPPQAPRVQGSWSPPVPPQGRALRVLLLENNDSFSQNLVHDLAAIGASVKVISSAELHTHSPAALLQRAAADAVLVGPGPGTPQSSGCLPMVRHCLEVQVPLLGVCLGHQALGEAIGGRVVRAGAPIHGRSERISHHQKGLWDGVPQHASFGRYHSLAVADVPEEIVSARALSDGSIQAFDLSPLGHKAWSVQFHPESVLSLHGRRLLHNWLALC